MLCGDCDGGLKRDGANRPSRWSMIGADKPATAREMRDAAPTLPGAVTAQGHIGRALNDLESRGEAAAVRAPAPEASAKAKPADAHAGA